ncbi:hypothetical protein [Bacillus phage CP-51]|uniref:Uncharacterized protein n=1 Tax=Bacillus phage CP-51 TaxID=1391188 RepID=A0A068EMV1_9CAUD|nr:hypothetical protein OZ73_gp125 [Bacillus phage CP-51]AID50560.1 hypothetical protein [Bacillus phage CP-51]
MAETLEEVVGMKVQNKVRKGVLKSSGMIQEIPEGEVVDFITCSECGANHVADSEGYLELLGNLHVGGGGGLIGNGDWEKHGAPIGYYCVKDNCLSNRIRKDEEDIQDSMARVRLFEGETLIVVCLVEVPSGENVIPMTPQSSWDIVEKRHDVIELALLDSDMRRDFNNTRVLVPRNLIREWVRTCKIKRNHTERP